MTKTLEQINNEWDKLTPKEQKEKIEKIKLSLTKNEIKILKAIKQNIR